MRLLTTFAWVPGNRSRCALNLIAQQGATVEDLCSTLQ